MVKQGYKQTEIGIIPEDWACVKIEDIARILMCKRIFADQTSDFGEIPFYKIGTFGKEADAYISRSLYNEFKRRFSFPKKGDVLISAAGTLGRTVVYDGKDAYFQDSNIVWLDVDESRVSNQYLKHYYDVIKWVSSEGSTIARLYNGIIYNTYIPLPSIEEQQKISEALSDVDSMISSLEKLIAKKKAIKQGAMKELLTGKKRLSGFTGEWKYLKIKETGLEVLKGQTITQKDVSFGRIPVVAGGKTPAYYCDKSNRTGVNITISASGASAGFVNIYREDIFASDCSTISEGEKYNIDFVYNVLLNAQETIYASQTGGAQPHIHPNDIYELKVHYTFDVEEQNAIASILSDMDNEIEALEHKLAKTRQLKQGMMQQLLTGKIRLV